VEKKGAARFFLASSALALASAAQAGETVTYSYDALGRLVATTSSGTVNDGLTTSLAYDPAGNRSTYMVSGAGGGAPPPSPPGPVPPPPPAGNQPPVALDDTGGTTICRAAYFNVLSNDSDPDGNTPLTLVSVSSNGLRGDASVAGSQVYFAPNGITGAANVTYTIRDSLGATASAVLSLTLSRGTCAS
jgi:uncharacterized protein RhaS with RHS repeats